MPRIMVEELLEHEWRPDITLNKFSVSAEQSNFQDDKESAEEKERLLTRSATLYIKFVVQSLRESGSHIPAKHHRLLVEWMEGYLRSSCCAEVLHSSLDEEKTNMRLKNAGVEGEMISRMGPRLLDVISGKIDPLSVMLEDVLLYRVYADDSSVRCYTHLISYLRQLAFKKPYLKVLEIGAGTGGTTLPLLKAHDDSSNLFFRSYDFTDISSGFFDQVQSKFEEWKDLLQYRVLKIERDPAEQGFTTGSYDLIVASNVVHATKYLGKTLSNVRKLLKLEGHLALLEIVNLTPPYMMTFGLLPGWWAGVEDGRMQGPLLPVSQWNEVLFSAGFTGTDIVFDDREGYAHRSSLMISGLMKVQTSRSNPSIKTLPLVNPTIQGSALLEALASELESRKVSPTFIAWPAAEEIDESVYIIMDTGDEPLLLNPTQELFFQISLLCNRASHMLWITGCRKRTDSVNAEKGIVTGFTRTARTENVSLKVMVFDIQQDMSVGSDESVRTISSLLYTLLFHGSFDNSDSPDMEYAYRDGQLFIPRLIPDEKINHLAMNGASETSRTELSPFYRTDRALRLKVQNPGLLDSCIFTDDEIITQPLKSDELTIRVMACGVNFKDVFISLGQMKPGTRMAGECAGIIIAVGSDFRDVFEIGDRVCAFDATPFANQVRVRGFNAYLIPESMSFPEAASLPVVFGTAYHSLINSAHLQPGQTILIHAASGGVGQAAIKLAQHIGAEIFATVGSDAKRQLLIERYNIHEDHIFSSRTRDFKNQILRFTRGKGVDVALNSLSSEALHDT